MENIVNMMLKIIEHPVYDKGFKDIELHKKPFHSCGELTAFTELCESLFDHENS